MKQFVCIGLGEVLWDVLPSGKLLGGAPANFAYHASALGGDGRVLSRVGDDSLGREIIARLQSLGLSADGVQVDPKAPTSTVSVELAADKSAHYIIHENVAWDFLEDSASARSLVGSADAICFGSLAQRTRGARIAVRRLLDSARRDSVRVFDINLRQLYYSKEIIEQSIARSSILKINDQELPIMAGLFNLSGDVCTQLQRIVDRDNLRGIAYTRGANGSMLFIDGQWSDRPGVATTVVDTIGAGDSFTAAMTIGLLKRWPIEQIHDRASQVAAFVCSQPGGTPALPVSIKEIFM